MALLPNAAQAPSNVLERLENLADTTESIQNSTAGAIGKDAMLEQGRLNPATNLQYGVAVATEDDVFLAATDGVWDTLDPVQARFQAGSRTNLGTSKPHAMQSSSEAMSPGVQQLSVDISRSYRRISLCLRCAMVGIAPDLRFTQADALDSRSESVTSRPTTTDMHGSNKAGRQEHGFLMLVGCQSATAHTRDGDCACLLRMQNGGPRQCGLDYDRWDMVPPRNAQEIVQIVRL